MKIRVGVVGYGYWGPNLARNFAECPGAELAMVCDLSEQRLAIAKLKHPSIQVTQNYQDLLSDPTIQAIAIATPVSSHFPLALKALEAGKHVLVEKPLTSGTQEGLKLLEVSRQHNLILMVDHTFVYTGVVRKIRDLIASNDLGEIYYYDSIRVNLGLFQHDVNVLWDLAVHDLSVMRFVLPQLPTSVSATGVSHVPGQPENLAYLTLFFESSLIAHINVNWLAPVKLRRTLIGGSRKMIFFNDLEPSEKLKIYDRGIVVQDDPEQIYQLLVGYRSGDILSPQVEISEALQVEVQHFLDCIQTGKTPLSDGVIGLQIVQILEAAELSMKNQGKPISLDFLQS